MKANIIPFPLTKRETRIINQLPGNVIRGILNNLSLLNQTELAYTRLYASYTGFHPDSFRLPLIIHF